jgi:nucleoside 2-deoxyribosyltransferase
MADGAPVVYLAGPEVFLVNAVEIGAAKVAICAAHGLDGRFPLDMVGADELEGLAPAEQAAAIFDGLVAGLDHCAAVIANMTPFRGPSTDVGTAWEMGYAAGRGLPVFAYTNDVAHYGERVAPDGMDIEAFDLADNLMLARSVARHGGDVLRHDSGVTGAKALLVLDGFEQCVQRAAAALVGH